MMSLLQNRNQEYHSKDSIRLSSIRKLIVRALLTQKLARVFPKIIGYFYNSPRYCCLVSHRDSDCYRSQLAN